jgi:hypothetical protein
MSNMDIGQSPVEIGNKRMVQNFRRKGANPRDLKTTRRTTE